MMSIIEYVKVIIKKEFFQSILVWATLSLPILYVFKFITGAFIRGELNPTGINLIEIIKILTYEIVVLIILGLLLYTALKNNWEKLGLTNFILKVTYLSFILLFIYIFEYIIIAIGAEHAIGYIPTILILIIPLLIKNNPAPN